MQTLFEKNKKEMEAIETLKFFSLDIIILMIPILFIISTTINGVSTKAIIIYGTVISIITGIIIQSRYPGHAHVPGSEVFFALLALLICFCIMAIALFLRKISKNVSTSKK